MKFLRRWYYKLFPTYRRLELRCVNYFDANKMLRESEGKPEGELWHLAIPEEDYNRMSGFMVYLERKIRIYE